MRRLAPLVIVLCAWAPAVELPIPQDSAVPLNQATQTGGGAVDPIAREQSAGLGGPPRA